MPSQFRCPRLVALLAFVAFATLPASASIITVTTTDDLLALDSECSLREALLNAENDDQAHLDCDMGSGTDSVRFDIPGAGPHVILLASDLPQLTDPIDILGTSQAGTSCLGWPRDLRIALRANYAGGVGLDVGEALIIGLVFGGFDDAAIRVRDDSARILCNSIGLDADGSTSRPNGIGIDVAATATNTVIGGLMDTAGNLVSGNSLAGIETRGTDTLINGNRVGSDATGLLARPNGAVRGGIYAIDAVRPNIGGVPAARNLVSGNAPGPGITVMTSTDASIDNNWVGVDAAGSAALPNQTGIRITGSGATVTGNLVSGNTGSGIVLLTNPTEIDVDDNTVGLAADGVASLGNGGIGIQVFETTARIGEGAANVVSANGSQGISLDAADGSVLANNLVGTDAAGVIDRGNASSGLFSRLSEDLVVTGNLVSANGVHGMLLDDAHRAAITANLIGTDLTGTQPLGNGGAGIAIEDSLDARIGGVADADANRIAYSALSGILVAGVADDLTMLGNSLEANGQLGIDLLPPLGVVGAPNPNDPGDPDTLADGPNDLQNFPDLAAATIDGGTTTLDGQLDSLANTLFTIEVFASAACDPSGFGEAERRVDSFTTLTGGDGLSPFQVAIIGPVAEGELLTATATSPDGDTSELSNCVEVVAATPEIPTASTVGLLVLATLLALFGTAFLRR